MLNSSDAKWRCMWHMLVCSLLLTLVSQFLRLTEHIPFYIFAALTLLVLPMLTAIYSHTSGKHGAAFLRVGYVFCDPVLSCIALSPVLLLNHLHHTVADYQCLAHHTPWNNTYACIKNRSGEQALKPEYMHQHQPSEEELVWLQKSVEKRLVTIQFSIAAPILVSLLMWRRTHKMSFNTYLLTFAYWFVLAIEAVDMIEAVRLSDVYNDIVFTTEAIVSIGSIITNSYAIVTLCSYMTPLQSTDAKLKKFDFLYRVFVAVAGIFLGEIPMLVGRFQLLMADSSRMLPATFYLWGVKDITFILLMIFIFIVERLRDTGFAIRCKVNFDNPTVFEPEKRDEYISQKKRVRFQDPPVTVMECEPVTKKSAGSSRRGRVVTSSEYLANVESYSKTGDNGTGENEAEITCRPGSWSGGKIYKLQDECSMGPGTVQDHDQHGAEIHLPVTDGASCSSSDSPARPSTSGSGARIDHTIQEQDYSQDQSSKSQSQLTPDSMLYGR